MKSDNNIDNDDLITYNIDGVNYKFKSNPAMLDIFKSIIETLPLQKYLDNERSKRNIEPQQPSTGSIWNKQPHPPSGVCLFRLPAIPTTQRGVILWFKMGYSHPAYPYCLTWSAAATVPQRCYFDCWRQFISGNLNNCTYVLFGL